MDARFQQPTLVPPTVKALAGWQTRAAIAYPALLVLAVMLTVRGGRGPTPLQSDLTIYWVWADQFASELAHGNFYPRWMALSDSGLGTPVFYFYPPIAFYLAAVFQIAGLSNYASLILVFGVSFAVSGIACWHWLRWRSTHPLLAAAFFMAAPYHLFDYSDRAALAESVAVAMIPLIAIGLRRIGEGRGGIVFTALAYGAMIGTHLPLALLISVFLIAPYALVHRQHLQNFAVAVGIGIALAAIYLVPAFALQSFRDVDQLYRTPNLQTGYWSIFSQNWNDVAFAATFLIIAAIVAAALIPAVIRHDRWALHALVMAIVISGVLPFLWSLPLLRNVQFPFRALAIAEFSLATAFARLPTKPSLAMMPMMFPLFVSLVVLPGFHSGGSDLLRLRTTHPDAYEYLPKGVIQPGQTSTTLQEVLKPRVPPPNVPGNVVEPHFYFPAWSCGKEEPRTQLLMHEPSCRPTIAWTWSEKLGAMISLVAALALAWISHAWGRPRPSFRRNLLATQATAG
jgi:hypothetical protein